MLITRTNMDTLFASYNAAFRDGVEAMQASSQYMQVATVVPSSTAEEVYAWLGKISGLKEWIGERQVRNVRQHGYTLRNRDFEDTVEVDRNHIEDDKFGIYAPLFARLGEAVGAHPDELVWPLLKEGFSELCYDGQYFFDSDHPVIQADGSTGTVSNTGGGNGTPWYLMDLRGSFKPLVFQLRKRADNIVRKDREEDDNVFDRRHFQYGVHARSEAGFGFWQKAYGSKQALNKANYEAARVALHGMKGDHGRPLGMMPTHLVVPPALEKEGLELVNAERDAAGATNVYRGTAQLLMVPWLA
ncbi:MAG: Mu-like prophage major head subunit gpT family protein [Defluviicoccus sp.]|nr:Mu-like prophage major head subunit gpT family protein [Defluviicoccus sp.]